MVSHLTQSATLRSSTGPGPQPLLSSAMSPAWPPAPPLVHGPPARPLIGQGASEHRRLEPFSAGTHCEDESDQLGCRGRHCQDDAGPGEQLWRAAGSVRSYIAWTTPPCSQSHRSSSNSNEWTLKNQESSSETFHKVKSVLLYFPQFKYNKLLFLKVTYRSDK